jgi:hypothetical protein
MPILLYLCGLCPLATLASFDLVTNVRNSTVGEDNMFDGTLNILLTKW